VRDDDNPYLAYSPGISIEESSEPFRAFLGANLSVVKGVPVESSTYNPNIKLDTIDGPLPEYDIDNAGPPMARSHDRNSRGNTESELLVHTFLGRYRSLGSLTFRLLRLLPKHLKTSKYGHASIPCRITRSPFHSGLGTIKYAYGLPVI
jgi:hypothetical protein